jgi:hypothetical protein
MVDLHRRERHRNHWYGGLSSGTLLHLINSPEGYDFDTLRHYSILFPNEALTRLIQAYLVYLGVPLSDDDDETTTTRSVSLDDMFSVISVRFRFVLAPLARYQAS